MTQQHDTFTGWGRDARREVSVSRGVSRTECATVVCRIGRVFTQSIVLPPHCQENDCLEHPSTRRSPEVREEWRGLESGREEEDGTVVRRREKREKGKEEEGTYMKSGQSYVSTNAQRAVQRRTTPQMPTTVVRRC